MCWMVDVIKTRIISNYNLHYDLYIEKQEVSDDLNDDFKKLGIQGF